MIDLLFIVFLIIFLVYRYTSTNIECNTAASTYLQIWTGSCGMACRHSGYSQFTDMSSLNQPARLPLESNAPGNDCICGACPCAFIENVLRRCQPATDMCEHRMEEISVYMAGIMSVVNDVYVTLMHTFQTEPSTQRQAELVSRRETYESNQNLTFDREKTQRKASKIFGLPKFTDVARKKSFSESLLRRDTLKEPAPAKKVNTSFSATSPPIAESSAATGSPTPTPAAVKSSAISFAPLTSTSAPVTSSSTVQPPATSQDTSEASCLKCISDSKPCTHNCPKLPK